MERQWNNCLDQCHASYWLQFHQLDWERNRFLSSGTTNPASITMNGPITENAAFTRTHANAYTNSDRNCNADCNANSDRNSNANANADSYYSSDCPNKPRRSHLYG